MTQAYDGRMMVKQYVAVVRSAFSRFRVFETQDAKWYLFDQLLADTTISTGLQFPVRKADLRPDIRSALRRGWGNSL